METLIFRRLVAEVKEAWCRERGELSSTRRGNLHVHAGVVLTAVALCAQSVLSGQTSAPTRDTSLRVSVLVYHRFAPVVKDSMTVRTSTFRWQLDYLKQHQQPVITLRALVSYLEGKGAPPPPRAVVITADDGHESVFTDMLPAIREYQVPVTLFIYPSAISNASYAMTWQQLVALRETRLFDIQSHTYWHPNFKTEKRRLSADAFRAFAANQLVKPRMVLEKRLGIRPDVLAWPFGIYDDELLAMAREAGYDAAFTIDGRAVTSREQIMALPRFL